MHSINNNANTKYDDFVLLDVFEVILMYATVQYRSYSVNAIVLYGIGNYDYDQSKT